LRPIAGADPGIARRQVRANRARILDDIAWSPPASTCPTVFASNRSAPSSTEILGCGTNRGLTHRDSWAPQ